MKTLFIAAGHISWASSRLRCYWIAPYMDADIVTYQQGIDWIPMDYDSYIFQKSCSKEQVELLAGNGKQIFYDACDPLHWFDPMEFTNIIPFLNGIATSSEALKDDIELWFYKNNLEPDCPVVCIPDRMEMSQYPLRRKHEKADPVRFIWYGMSTNRIGLYGAWATLCRLAANGYKIELTVFDDQPGSAFTADNDLPIYYTRWSVEMENQVIAAHDIAILPDYPGEWGQVKSNNKALTALACGLPVVDTDMLDYYHVIDLVESHEARTIEAARQMHENKDLFDVRQSAQEWLAFMRGETW